MQLSSCCITEFCLCVSKCELACVLSESSHKANDIFNHFFVLAALTALSDVCYLCSSCSNGELTAAL